MSLEWTGRGEGGPGLVELPLANICVPPGGVEGDVMPKLCSVGDGVGGYRVV